MSKLKDFVRNQLSHRGWFLRKLAGLPAGISIEHDMLSSAGLLAPQLILDVGAHQGETAERFVHAFPVARILSFEPIAANFLVLSARAQAWHNVTCFKLGLSDRTGQSNIVLQDNSQTHSLELRHPSTSRSGGSLETIDISTLDNFVAIHQLPRIDLLKVDVEGHELAVLRGAANMFARQQIDAVLLEATLDPEDSVHTQLAAAIDWLRPHGFKLTALYDQAISRQPTKLAYFNALFVSSMRSAPLP